MAFVVYVCFLAAYAFPLLALVGLVLAYINRDAAPEWLKTHYTFQIRTFWIGLLYWLVSIVLCAVLIGLVCVVLTLVWGVLRCGLGLNRLMQRQPYPNPESWIT